MAPPSSESSGVSTASPRPSRQVSKFKDEYSIVMPYCGTFEFEYNPDFDYKEEIDIEDEEDTNHVAEPRETLIKYVAQIRKSFGFDVDCIAPSWFNGTFVPFDLEKDKLKYPTYYKDVLNAVDFAIAEINSDLLMSGKSYELVKIEKLVRARPWKKFFTLRVKEVDGDHDTEKIIQAIVFENRDDSLKLFQWRFKPAEDDAWYQPRPIAEEYPWLVDKYPSIKPPQDDDLATLAKDV